MGLVPSVFKFFVLGSLLKLTKVQRLTSMTGYMTVMFASRQFLFTICCECSVAHGVTKSVPFCITIRGIVLECLSDGVKKLLILLWEGSVAIIDTQMAFLFGVEKPIWLHSKLGTHQGEINVTGRAAAAACVEDVVERLTPGDDEVKLVPMT